MSFADTVANDYKVFDATQTVTFSAVRTAGTTNYTVTHADDHDLTTREILAGEGMFKAGDKRWSLGANQITVAANAPQAGDYITDAGGTVWRVLDVVLDDLGISFFCSCTKAR